MKIIILGGGIAGLSLAWSLLNKGHEIEVVEKSSCAGGWIRTIEKDGYLFDCGPHSFRTNGKGASTLTLIEALGMQSEIAAPSSHAKHRYLWTGSSLKKLPASFYEAILSPVLWRCLAGAAAEPFKPRGRHEDESVASFIQRRFGNYIAGHIFDPLVAGIFAGTADDLSMRSCFPDIWLYEQEAGSVIRGLFRKKKQLVSLSPFASSMQRWPMLSFRRGFQSLINALSAACKNCISLNEEVLGLKDEGSGIAIITSSGKRSAELAISTLPVHALARLISLPSMQQVKSASVEVTMAGYRKPVFSREGFGYLVPSQYRQGVLGVIWDSSLFPEQNSWEGMTRLTVMACPNGWQGLTGSPLALRALHQHLGIKAAPDFCETRILKNAIPQYPVGYHRLKEEALSQAGIAFPRLVLAGTAFTGVAVNDAIDFALNFDPSE